MKNIFIKGDKYNRLMIVGEVEQEGRRRVLCKCDCGVVKEFLLSNLRNGHTKSCGCLNKELIKERSFKHGCSGYNKIPLYSVWTSMKQRCYNKKDKSYHNYGGRGISICTEWMNDFKLFYDWSLINGYKKGLQIDREDNDGDYTPNNCRFVTVQINVLNKRKYKNNTSGYIGIIKRKNKTFNSIIMYKDRRILLDKSGFKTAKSAAIYRDIYIIKNNLPHQLNFPELNLWSVI
ncbi:MAG: AP2 domain-containing protein [Lutibacter sp.]|uniref:hypothetical protein n=1 Tax=Lutibacter sp. TaxID=1925666 RepID=UPI0019FDAB7B|nr:hypothetical protein [Lutibacter sp.]NOR27639.1 AP2 domain-containing protein [Lutibacter sp.]